MKKIIVLAAMMTLVAGSAFALIGGSDHDLSSTGPQSYTTTGTSNEICVYCHTPHNGGSQAPLWNRTTPGAAYTYYNSVTLESSSAATAIAGNNTDLPLCMSCHDGVTQLDSITNGTGSETYGFTPAVLAAGSKNLGTDLTNDHPVGMIYATSQSTDAGLFADNGDGTVGTADNLQLFDNGTTMWCSTCHDVHNGTAFTPFLNATMASSQLCLNCHNK